MDEGDHWKLNGSKIFITNAGFADVFIIIAVTNFVTDKPAASRRKSAPFIVGALTPASRSASPERQDGHPRLLHLRADHGRLHYRKTALLGVKGRGFQLAANHAGRQPLSALPPRLWASLRAPLTRPLPTSRAQAVRSQHCTVPRTPSLSWPR